MTSPSDRRPVLAGLAAGALGLANGSLSLGLGSLGAAFGSWPKPAGAQSWPERPLRFIIPYPPGGLADSFARAMSDHLAQRLGQQVVVDNRPGGSLVIGTEVAARSPADGYTILLASSTSLGLNASAFKKLPYDPVKDFAPISVAFYTPLYLIVSNSVPVNNVRDLIQYAKANPGKLSFASLGHGSSLHLAGEMFRRIAAIDILHVPYKGTTTALPDLLSGQVSMIFDGGAFLPQVQAGKAKLLAVTSTSRLESAPDVPTMAEAGLPGYEVDFWFGIVAPAGTPRPVVDRLAGEIATIVRTRSFTDRLSAYGNMRPFTNTPDRFAALIKEDIRKWDQILKDSGVEPQ
ncbi:MAG TPA: tripartite tricarboxylate transporter substrate binding protein [Burkholderiaceae bacterium]|nr:tripartite tricarboxylate transporter substrate binding protein [Burkholderiaceae bacterium]